MCGSASKDIKRKLPSVMTRVFIRETCPICMEDFEEVASMPFKCGHLYCDMCKYACSCCPLCQEPRRDRHEKNKYGQTWLHILIKTQPKQFFTEAFIKTVPKDAWYQVDVFGRTPLYFAVILDKVPDYVPLEAWFCKTAPFKSAFSHYVEKVFEMYLFN